MSIFGARRDDWHPGNPSVNLGSWIGGMIAAIVFYFVVAATIGTIINGNGAPFVGHLG